VLFPPEPDKDMSVALIGKARMHACMHMFMLAKDMAMTSSAC